VLVLLAAQHRRRNARAAARTRSTRTRPARDANDPLLGKADRISGEEVRGLVTFTFDDGPNPGTTEAVVGALEKYNIPATFFIVTRRLVGKHGEQGRALLRQILEKGFLVASHSVSHPNLRGASPARLAAEIDQSIRTLSTEAERPIGMFRAPFGAIDARGRAWLKKRGLTEAFWSIDTLDWQAKHAERLRKKVFKMIVAQEGGVVLMHDVKSITAEVIANVLDDLEAENCRRLEVQRSPIWPVSIHYFLRDKKKLRDIPDDVKKTTEAYRLALPLRCAARPKPTPDLLRPLFLE
jgi:peptidoglycan/xylan/chitin deacetylase (PgdA/CDA1 family)